MGMDVFGKNPASEQGKHFRNNVWWWRPLADYCIEVAPEICLSCAHWHTNDGDGLDAAAATSLAAALQREVDADRTAAYARRYESAQELTPNEACPLCDGTGTRRAVPERGAGGPHGRRHRLCNQCNGTGHVRPWSTEYPFSVENVVEFVAFLRECGGFEIF